MLFLEGEDPDKPINLYINSPGGRHDGLLRHPRHDAVPARAGVDDVRRPGGVGGRRAARRRRARACASRCPTPGCSSTSPTAGRRASPPTSRSRCARWSRCGTGWSTSSCEATGQTRERIVADIDRDHILRGDDAVAYGLVDDVLSTRELRAVPGEVAIALTPRFSGCCVVVFPTEHLKNRAGGERVAQLARAPTCLRSDLVEATPDAVRFADADGVAQAGLTDRAGGADPLGPVLTLELLVLALEVGRWEEHLGLRPAARGLHLPGLVDTLCAHVASPFRRRPYSRPLSAKQGSTSASTPLDDREHSQVSGGCRPRGLGRVALHGAGREPGKSHQWPSGSIGCRGLAVVRGGALGRLDLEQQPVDRHHPHLLARLDRGGPVGAGPPRGVADGDHAVRGDGARRPCPPRRSSTHGRWSGWRSGCGPWPACRRSSPVPSRRSPPGG